MLVTIRDYHMSFAESLNHEKVEIYKIVLICILHKYHPLIPCTFLITGDEVSSANICEFAVDATLNMSRRPARRDPAQVGAPRSRQAEALYVAGRTAPPRCRYVTACGYQRIKSYISGHKLMVIGKLTSRHRPFCLLLWYKERKVNRTASRLPLF